MSIKKNRIYGALTLLILMGVIVQILGHDLRVSKPVDSRVDAIVVLSGGRGARVQKAVALYKAGSSRSIVLNGGQTFLWQPMTTFLSDYAQLLGVPQSAIIELSDARSTYENAITTKAYVENHHLNSICIVTSTYHTGRAYRTFKKVFKNTDVKLYIVGAEDGIDYKNWWKNYEMSSTILQEWAKTIIYRIKY